MSAELMEHPVGSDELKITELQALASAPIGLAVTSLAGSLRYANSTFGEFFNFDPAAHLGDDIREITRKRIGENLLMSVAREGGVRQVGFLVDGNRMLLCSARRVMHGPFPIFLSLVVQDISELSRDFDNRFEVLREQLDGCGVRGVWNWTMRIYDAENIGSNPIAWISSDASAFGSAFEPKTFSCLMQRMAPHCRARVAAEVARAIETRSRYVVDYEIVGRDGSVRRMRSAGRYLELTHSAARRLVGIEMELQPQRSNEGSDELHRELLEQMELPVLSIDRHMRYRYFNSAFESFAHSVGYQAVELDQPVLNTVSDPVRRRRLAEVLARVMKGEPAVYETKYYDDRGEVYLWMDFHFTPTRDASGAVDGAMAVGYDVSPLKRANLYHKLLNAEVKQRLDHRTASIDAANRDLSNQVAAMCGDLRARLEELKGAMKTQSTAAAIADMEARIGQLAALSSIGLRRPEPRKIDMNRLVREVLRELGNLLGERTVEFDIASLPHVVADRALVRQVFQSLLSNAIKFTRGCPSARIRVWTAVEEGTTVWSVSDNGIGFDPREGDEMFHTFARRGTKPRGVGLSVAWRAIQQLDGRLWCDSSPGQGATFHFTIGQQELAN